MWWWRHLLTFHPVSVWWYLGHICSCILHEDLFVNKTLSKVLSCQYLYNFCFSWPECRPHHQDPQVLDQTCHRPVQEMEDLPCLRCPRQEQDQEWRIQWMDNFCPTHHILQLYQVSILIIIILNFIIFILRLLETRRQHGWSQLGDVSQFVSHLGTESLPFNINGELCILRISGEWNPTYRIHCYASKLSFVHWIYTCNKVAIHRGSRVRPIYRVS